MVKQAHLASQYLAMANKSFLEPKEDDSHTNLGFFKEDNTLRTWKLNDSNVYLAFNYIYFSLQWCSLEGKSSCPLDGKKHTEIIEWISKMAKASKIKKSYQYNLHYDLPYEILNDFKFKLSDSSALNKLLQLRIMAQNAIEGFLDKEKMKSDIRIWPHHFDTGAFLELNDGSGKSIGLGMAIPDAVCDEHYFYISGYKGHEPVKTQDFNKLVHGEWKKDSFNGAILKISIANEKNVIHFLSDALVQYKTRS